MDREPFARPRSHYVAGGLFVLVGIVVGLGLSLALDLQRDAAAQRHDRPVAVGLGSGLESPFVTVVEKALPAVVFVDAKKKVAETARFPQDELMRRFFGQEAPPQPRVAPSAGSGFIIDRAGHILTNNHVVANAQDITITLNDQRTFPARVVGTDPETDVAVLKITGDDLPILPLGDSDRLRIGDWAIAIGNPLGQLRGSVTVGIISAQGRSTLNIFGGTPVFQDFIQTDASINFGNSGGPLCNVRGEAVGINTAINPNAQGIGFAIPINLARHVADQLIATGKVKRSWMGVTLADLTPELAEGFGLKDRRGVLVQSVLKGQPADRAGLRRNDVIVELNGDPVTEMQKFRIRIADMPVGSRIQLVVLRDGRRVPIGLTLAERTDAAVAQSVPAGGDEGPLFAGLRVRDLTAAEKDEAGVAAGVVIASVAAGGAGEEAGLQPGDVIEEVGGKPVASSEAFRRALNEAKAAGKRNAVLLVTTQAGTRYVPLRLE